MKPSYKQRLILTAKVTTLRPFRQVKNAFGWFDLACRDAWDGLKAILIAVHHLLLLILAILFVPLSMVLPLVFWPHNKRANWVAIRNHAEGRDVYDDGDQ